MSAMERATEFFTQLNTLNTEGASSWFEIQRKGVEAVVSAVQARNAALQNVKGVEDWASAERAFWTALNDSATETFKANVELAQAQASRAQTLFGELVPAPAA